MDYLKRLERLQGAMQQAGIDGLIYGLGANFQYYTGSTARWTRESEQREPLNLLVVSRTSTPAVIATGEEANSTVPAGLPVATVSSREELITLLGTLFDGSQFGTGRQASDYLTQLISDASPGSKCVDAESLGDEWRMIKDSKEIVRLRAAAALTDKVMGEVAGQIRPGLTQLELQLLIAQVGFGLGAQDVSFSPAGLYVKSGTEPTEDPFVYPKDQGLVAGTSIAFDFGFVLDGYCSDFGRSFYFGPAPAHISSAYRALQEAQCYLIGRMRPGMRTGDMTAVLLTKLDELGYGDRFRARLPCGTLGHQIGVDLHENPWIKPECNTLLAPGMVMCIEPKVWLPGEYYLRVEDMVLVTETGAESLTNFDRTLFEIPS
jgi:Xaa-Pro aminopeptidase